eukprot:gb/GECH01009019.1/.p1 GENE.gb/GECH01009019.1/~~gb/GECH01009019.1/.p1  ORF type:complete len:181 (+),score=27.82 gb/GECH01009019.1/:1-543(+)
MGIFSRILKAVGLKKRKVRILCCGIDNSGKTTIINHFHSSVDNVKNEQIVPTVGFSVEKFIKNNLKFTVFDMSGQGKYRTLWEYYYSETEGVIFVIDSSDTDRLPVVKDELHKLLNHKDFQQDIPLLFFLNKIDLPDSESASFWRDGLEIYQYTELKWHMTWDCSFIVFCFYFDLNLFVC